MNRTFLHTSARNARNRKEQTVVQTFPLNLREPWLLYAFIELRIYMDVIIQTGNSCVVPGEQISNETRVKRSKTKHKTFQKIKKSLSDIKTNLCKPG